MVDSIESMFYEEMGDKLDKADQLVLKSELEFASILNGEIKSNDANKSFEKEYKTLTDRLRELNRKLKNSRNTKTRRADVNKKEHDKRAEMKMEIEDIKLKLQDLQYEMQGRLEHECKTDEEKQMEMAKFKAKFIK